MRWFAAFALPLVVAAVATSIIGWREATRTPIVAAYDIAVPDWPAGQPPLRIVQLSDTHAGPPDMPFDRLRAIIAQANALKPDLIVLTGDYQGQKFFVRRYGNLDDVVRPFAALRSRLGTFAVRGNHDNGYWSPTVIPRYGITYLQNSWADAGPVTIAGVDDFTNGRPHVGLALMGVPANKPVIMLMHEPDSFVEVPASVALTFAGHTHGGQILIPGLGAPQIGTAFGRAHRRGLYVESGRRLIVSSGVGTTAIPLRLGVPPEIVVVTLHR